jgi:hypothetical protein
MTQWRRFRRDAFGKGTQGFLLFLKIFNLCELRAFFASCGKKS